MSFTVIMKVDSSLVVTMLLALFNCSIFLLSLRIASAENDDNDSEESLAKIKQTIKQNEECEVDRIILLFLGESPVYL